MINKELVDYIKAQLDTGVASEKVKENLTLQGGWEPNDIEEALAVIQNSTSQQEKGVAKNNHLMIIALGLIGLVVAGAYFYISNPREKESEVLLVEIDIETNLVEIEPVAPNDTAQAGEANVVANTELDPDEGSSREVRIEEVENPEFVFANQLSSCTPDNLSFNHPITGDVLEKQIVGLVDRYCVYIEQMPNGGQLTCTYSEEDRKVAAQYYIDYFEAESTGFLSGIPVGPYTMNGKKVANPLQEATMNGTCVITGYE